MKNPKTAKHTVSSTSPKRESPNDFMRAFLRFIQSNPEHKSLTPKGFAILRGIRDGKK
jgi:hypothetical protein